MQEKDEAVDYIFSKRVQLAAVVAVVALSIIVIVDVFRGMTDLFVHSGPIGFVMSMPLALAAGLITWGARQHLEGGTGESE